MPIRTTETSCEMPVIREIRCRSILNRSRIPGLDYAINPYLGCQHGCIYCYSDFMGRFHPHQEAWGNFVDVKINSAEVLQEQLRRAKPGLVSLSTVTDPYQPIERKFQLSRACLKMLAGSSLSVSILTKSDLILRDLDILVDLPELDVGFTITTLREEIRRIFEPGAPAIRSRLRAVEKISARGIQTWVFLGPVLPYFSDRLEIIAEMLNTFRDHGAQRVLVDRLNLYPRVWHRVRSVVGTYFPEQLPYYEAVKLNTEEYASRLGTVIEEAGQQLNMPCEIIFSSDFFINSHT